MFVAAASILDTFAIECVSVGLHKCRSHVAIGILTVSAIGRRDSSTTDRRALNELSQHHFRY